MDKVNLKALSESELKEFMDRSGLPSFRARQLLQWVYERRVQEIGEITVFSKDLRARLSALAYISQLALKDRLSSSDGTEKFLFELEDGLRIESVLIPEDDRLTLCVSSQVGCAMGCAFCRTAGLGFTRSLKAHEIADQVIAVARLCAPRRITNIVLMGMGEPLMNLKEVAEALVRMNRLMGLSKRRITVSTSGVAPAIGKLAALLIPQDVFFNLAISLNATTDEERDQIMPINRKYPIKELMRAVRAFPLPRTRRITFEYVMVAGLNDSEADARRLAELLHGIPNKVNLIPLNEFEGCPWKRPTEASVERFLEALSRRGVTALIRKSKGRDIMAACGQLAAKSSKGENTCPGDL